MEGKKIKSGSNAARKGLGFADSQISKMKEHFLPLYPHFVRVHTTHPFNKAIPPYEYAGTPFDDSEVRSHQYFTMISDGDMGVAEPYQDWKPSSVSPSSIPASSTNTPNPNGAPKKKIPFSQYSKLKKNGDLKASPKPGDVHGGHIRNASAVSGGTPMSRLSSSESAVGTKENGMSVKPSLSATVSSTQKVDKPIIVQPSQAPEQKPRPPMPNGNSRPRSDSLQTKDTSHRILTPHKSHLPPVREPIKHPLPPRPHSPPRSAKQPPPEHKQQKRPLESADAGHSEKRSKIEHARTPSDPHKFLQRKPEPLETKSSPLKSQSQKLQSSSQPSPTSRKTTPQMKPIDTKETAKEKQLDLPPLLSPHLPADLDTASGFSSLKPSGKTSPKPSPKKTTPKPNSGGNTIIVAPPPNSTSSKAPQIPASSFELPPLLSPDLPEVVEKELDRLQKKKDSEKTRSLNSVESRHEKVRQPNAPGVAQKTPKIGHPPKKISSDSSRSKAPSSRESKIVILKFKKARRQDLQRLLNMKAKKHPQFLKLEAERLNPATPKNIDESEDDTPLSVVSKTMGSKTISTPSKSLPPSKPTSASKTVASNKQPPVSRKRSVEPESRSEPQPKRAKGPDSLDIAKTRAPLEPAFKSPGLPTSSQKHMLTPKKGDPTSSAMRKINSSDGHAVTPQSSMNRTPASAEKPRINGEIPAEQDTINKARRLKHKMDHLLQTKTGRPPAPTEKERKLGLCLGLECVATYMTGFAIWERLHSTRRANQWEDGAKLWEFIDRECRKNPVLHCLSSQIGALHGEELQRIYIDNLSKQNVFKAEDKEKELDSEDRIKKEVLPPKDMDTAQKEKDPEKDRGFDRLTVSASVASSSASSRPVREEATIEEKLVMSARRRDAGWQAANKARGALKDLGVNEMLGPWSKTEEVLGYVNDILERYSRREGLVWREA